MPIDESLIPVPDPAPEDFPILHDLKAFKARLNKAFARVAAIRPYEMESLGQVGGQDIFLISPTDLGPESRPSILTAAGFHGEEAAGPWGVLEYLETATEAQLKSINHSFLPLVNPTGFMAAQRFNLFGENPNRGFIAIPPELEESISGNNKFPSKEGEILIAHLSRLLRLGRDGLISQHEDWRMQDAFIFVNEREKMPSPFAQAPLGALKKYFNIASDDDPLLEGAPIKDGIWHNDLDGSFESLMMFYGVPKVATTETPGQKIASDRIAANRDIAAACADFFAKNVCNPA